MGGDAHRARGVVAQGPDDAHHVGSVRTIFVRVAMVIEKVVTYAVLYQACATGQTITWGALGYKGDWKLCCTEFWL